MEKRPSVYSDSETSISPGSTPSSHHSTRPQPLRQLGILDHIGPSSDFSPPKKAKIVLFGRQGVGKSSLAAMLCGKGIDQISRDSPGLSVFRTIRNQPETQPLILEFWECGALMEKRMPDLQASLWSDPVHAVGVLVSITDHLSLADALKQIPIFKKDRQHVILILTKCDLYLQGQVSEQEIEDVVSKWKLQCLKTSATGPKGDASGHGRFSSAASVLADLTTALS